MVSIVPNTFLLDLVNNINGGGNGPIGEERSFEFPAKKRSGKSARNFKFPGRKKNRKSAKNFEYPAKKRIGNFAFEDKNDQEEFERIVQMLQNKKM